MNKNLLAFINVLAVLNSTGSTTGNYSLCSAPLYLLLFRFFRRRDLFIPAVRKFLFVAICDTRVDIPYLFPFDFDVK